MEDFVLILRLQVHLRQVHALWVEVVKDLEKTVPRGKLFQRGDEDVLFGKLRLVPLEQFLLQLH